MEQWYCWKLQVFVDFYEMGMESIFYFYLGELLCCNLLIFEWVCELIQGIVIYYIDFFDGEGCFYMIEEGFDNFYVGKGFIYLQVNGLLGILFEIGVVCGGLIEVDCGIVSYVDNVWMYFCILLMIVFGFFV